jgi:hypothetical protein
MPPPNKAKKEFAVRPTIADHMLRHLRQGAPFRPLTIFHLDGMMQRM